MTKASKLYSPTIGLELHVELSTNSKMFCGCDNQHFGIKPNTHTCPVCLGLPGALPVPNKKAVDWTLMIGLALKSRINRESKFDRKHYFYPDLPKGYQISQYDEPFCTDGYLETSKGKVRITRVHLEEDTGKLIHRKVKGRDVTLIDFNRSGVPLVEVVTEPDIRSAAHAKEVAQSIRHHIRWLEVSECEMEKGSMRIEANVSLRTQNNKLADYKVEVKNINSFRYLEKAINYEIGRQTKLLSNGKKVKQETRGWDEVGNKTKSQRYKETASDYRYFPEPDIPPIKFSSSFIKEIRESLPEVSKEYELRFKDKYRVPVQYIKVLTETSGIAHYAEEALALALASKRDVSAKDVASKIVNRIVDVKKVSPKSLVDEIRKQKVEKVTDKDVLAKWADKAIDSVPKAVADYKKGKTTAIAALIGKVMKLSKGKADAARVKSIFESKLKKSK